MSSIRLESQTTPHLLARVTWPIFERAFLKLFALCCCPALSVCLSETLVYCSQTVGWIKMKLGMDVGLGPGHIVLDENLSPPRKAAQQPTRTFEIYGRRLCLRLHNPRPTSIVTKRLSGSRWTWRGGGPWPWLHCVRWGPSSRSPKGA